MLYFHDEASRTVYAVAEPTLSERRPKPTKRKPHPEVTDYDVSVEIAITKAGNWLTTGGLWHEPVTRLADQSYRPSQDTRESAMRRFRSWLFTSDFGTEVTRDEYEVLHARYEAEARSNRPPVGT